MEATDLERVLVKTGLDHEVTSADRLPTTMKKPAGLIVNTDPAHRPGTHWVSFYFPKRGPAEFFDSLGRSPEHYRRDFKNLLIAHGPDYLHNTGRIQDYGSATCGAYCLDFLMQRDRGVDYRSYLREWGDDYARNDALVWRRLRLE